MKRAAVKVRLRTRDKERAPRLLGAPFPVSLIPGAKNALAKLAMSLAGDLSEVTAL
jgi:hypothetical protein